MSWIQYSSSCVCISFYNVGWSSLSIFQIKTSFVLGTVGDLFPKWWPKLLAFSFMFWLIASTCEIVNPYYLSVAFVLRSLWFLL